MSADESFARYVRRELARIDTKAFTHSTVRQVVAVNPTGTREVLKILNIYAGENGVCVEVASPWKE